jgi:tetratricopeptide (TPR) repeat protein
MARALQMAEAVCGADSIETAAVLTSAASVAVLFKEDSEKQSFAVESLRRALRIRRSKPGSPLKDLIATFEQLASAIEETGDLREAVSTLGEALSICKQHSGCAANKMRLHGMLGKLNFTLHEREGSGEELKKASDSFAAELELRLADAGGSQVEVATAMCSLALTKEKAGDLKAACKLLESAADILRSHLGESHVQVAVAYCKLAAVLQAAGHPDDALRKYERALPILQARLGKNRVLVSETLKSIAELCLQRGNYDIAIEHFEHAVSIDRECHGADAAVVAESLYGLSRAFASCGHDRRALQSLESAVNVGLRSSWDSARVLPIMDDQSLRSLQKHAMFHSIVDKLRRPAANRLHSRASSSDSLGAAIVDEVGDRKGPHQADDDEMLAHSGDGAAHVADPTCKQLQKPVANPRTAAPGDRAQPAQVVAGKQAQRQGRQPKKELGKRSKNVAGPARQRVANAESVRADAEQSRIAPGRAKKVGLLITLDTVKYVFRCEPGHGRCRY